LEKEVDPATTAPRGVYERISRASGAAGAGGKAIDPASRPALIDVAQDLGELGRSSAAWSMSWARRSAETVD